MSIVVFVQQELRHVNYECINRFANRGLQNILIIF